MRRLFITSSSSHFFNKTNFEKYLLKIVSIREYIFSSFKQKFGTLTTTYPFTSIEAVSWIKSTKNTLVCERFRASCRPELLTHLKMIFWSCIILGTCARQWHLQTMPKYLSLKHLLKQNLLTLKQAVQKIESVATKNSGEKTAFLS